MQTEKEKMLEGKPYFSCDFELCTDRKFAREQMCLINNEKDDNIRQQMLKKIFGKVEGTCKIEPNIRFDYGYNIFVGKNFFANFNCTFLDVCPITFGDDCLVGPNVGIYTPTHPLEAKKRKSGLGGGKPVTIGNNVWIGGSAVILPGVVLGNNVVVGAGSVVTKSFPDNVMIVGNPARIIKEF